MGNITDKTYWHIVLAENNRDWWSVESVKCLSKVNEDKWCIHACYSTGINNASQSHQLFSGWPASTKTTLTLTELRINYWLQTAKEDFVEQFCAWACFCDTSLIIESSWIAILWYRNDHAFPPIVRNRVFIIQGFGVEVQHVRDFSLQFGYLQNTIRNIVEAGRCVITRRP